MRWRRVFREAIKGRRANELHRHGTHSIVHSAQLVKESTVEKVSKFATFCVKRCTKKWACGAFSSTDGDFDAPSVTSLLKSSLVDLVASIGLNRIQAMLSVLVCMTILSQSE